MIVREITYIKINEEVTLSHQGCVRTDLANRPTEPMLVSSQRSVHEVIG